jgi:pyrimidine operon attenuation protein/uracil phosphoribosyltransferase
MSQASVEILLDADQIARTLDRLADEVFTSLPEGVPVAIIGIRRRGELLAARLVRQLNDLGVRGVQHGALDITLYRDDLAELGAQAILRKTEIDFDIDGIYVVLVDDVLFTGRSIRAALDALVDLGRPQAIRLVILADRPGRELPIQADFVGVKAPRDDVPVTVLLTESDGLDEVRMG